MTILLEAEVSQGSDREIAKACGVSHMLVASVRRQRLEEMPDSAPVLGICGIPQIAESRRFTEGRAQRHPYVQKTKAKPPHVTQNRYE